MGTVSAISRTNRNRNYFYVEDYRIDLQDEKGQVYMTLRIFKDGSERKRAEENFKKIEELQKKEIHHRIKNNLQVISSLLSLQANYFKDEEVLEAFRKTQNRVVSIALIHEELYGSKNKKAIDFTAYLGKLTEELFRTYEAGNSGTRLQIDVKEHIFLDMDTAVPLGMIVNELVTNSLKHAFPSRPGGEIRIRFYRMRTDDITKNSASTKNAENSRITLIVSDDGSGFSEGIDFENPGTLGLQLVRTLVDQINGKIELKREQVTEIKIEFDNRIL